MAEFNEEALGIPLVGERDDSSLWIVDGLQRITALKKMGRKEVRAEVFASKGPEHEAAVFKLVNLNRTRLRPIEQFRALLAAHDELAWKVKNVVEDCGFKVASGRSGHNENAYKELTGVKLLMNVVRVHGVEPVRFALRAIESCWPGDRSGTHHNILSGLCKFFVRNQFAPDLERFYPRLRTVTPSKILFISQQTALGNDKAAAVADVLEKVYRKRMIGQSKKDN
jgi:hypothetical protein